VKLKAAMLDLLREAYTPWTGIVDDHHTSFTGPKADGELICGKGLGFDYSTAVGPEREYVFSVVRWAALKIGRRRRRFDGLRLDSPVPYYLPDGVTPRPVLLLDEWPTMTPETPLYNPLGVPTGYRTLRELAWYHIPDRAHERISATHHGQSTDEIKEALIEAGWEGAKSTLQLIEAHIARLEALWTEP
jgi:hypothetical protein